MTDVPKITIIMAALFLSACKPTEEEKQRVRDALPHGCELFDLGRYGEIDRLVVVKCDSATSTTVNASKFVTQGRTTSRHQYVAVEVFHD